MSGYGPPRGYRGINAWGAAASQRPDTAAGRGRAERAMSDDDRSHAEGALDRVNAWLRATGPAEHDPFCESAVVREGLNAGDPKLYRADVRAIAEQLAAANERAETAETARLNRQQAENERFNVLRGSNVALRAEIDRLEARLAEIGEVRQEWASAAPRCFMTFPGFAEENAREVVESVREHGGTATLKTRFVSEWREEMPADTDATETATPDFCNLPHQSTDEEDRCDRRHYARGGVVSGPGVASADDPGCVSPMPSRAQVQADWSDVRAARMDNPDAQTTYRAAADEHDREEPS